MTTDKQSLKDWHGWTADTWEVAGDTYVTLTAPTQEGTNFALDDLMKEPFAVIQKVNQLRREGDPPALQILSELFPGLAGEVLQKLLIQ